MNDLSSSIQCGSVNPGCNAEVANSKVHIWGVEYINEPSMTVKTKRVTDFPRHETDTTYQCTVVGAYKVVGVTLALPPSHKAAWRRITLGTCQTQRQQDAGHQQGDFPRVKLRGYFCFHSFDWWFV